MPANPKIVDQMRDRQRRMFRIALDPGRYGLTVKMIAADSGIDDDSLRNYAAGKTTMPITAVDALIDVLPDELLSLLFSGDRVMVKAPEQLDHDDVAQALCDYLQTKERAHHPESEAGREIGPGEDNVLRGKFARVRAR
jgi:hypothetical protein